MSVDWRYSRKNGFADYEADWILGCNNDENPLIGSNIPDNVNVYTGEELLSVVKEMEDKVRTEYVVSINNTYCILYYLAYLNTLLGKSTVNEFLEENLDRFTLGNVGKTSTAGTFIGNEYLEPSGWIIVNDSQRD